VVILKGLLVKSKRVYFFLIVVFFFSLKLQGFGKEVRLVSEKLEYQLRSKIDILEDRTKTLTIQQIQKAEFQQKFTPYQNIFGSIGYTSSAYWVKIQVDNQSKKGMEWFLEQNYPLIDYLDFYKPLKNKKYQRYATGDQTPFKTREIKNKNFIFNLSIQPLEKKTYYLRFETLGSMDISLHIRDSKSLLEKISSEQLILGTYYGIIIVMCVYNLFLYIFIRDKNYIYYVLFLSSQLLFQGSYNGLTFQLLWPDWVWWNNYSVPIFIYLGCFWMLQFSRSFLLSKVYNPVLNKTAIALMIFLIFGIIGSFLISYQYIIRISVVLILFSAVLVFVMGISSFIKKYRSARYFMCAWSILLLGIVITAFKNLGFLENNFFTEYTLQAGSIVEVLFLSLALADRIHILKQEKEFAQFETLEHEKIARQVSDEGEEKFRRLIDAAFDGVLIYQKLRIIEFSKDIPALFGYTTAEMINMNVFNLIDEKVKSELEERQIGVRDDISYEIEFLKKNKSTFFAEIVVTKQVYYGLTLWVIGIRDITQRKDAESALQKANEMKDEFLANTSHELRTPIHGIIGLAESLIEVNQQKTYSPKVFVRSLDMIVHSGKRLSNLVNDLLDFSKMKHQELVLQIKPVDCKSIIEIVLSLSETLIGNKDVKLISKISNDLPLIEADENRLQQIFYNLIGNAIKFTHQGEVEITAFQKNERVCIQVRDTGIGIPEKKLNQIFQSFEQVDSSIGREYGGTGIGLSITKQLVELHHGEIELESILDQGSIFSIWLPVAKDQSIKEQIAQSNYYYQESKKLENPTVSSDIQPILDSQFLSVIGNQKILIVDDEPINLELLQSHLTLQNYQVLTAQDGFQALELLKTENPDLVLLDLMMPRMSGYDVCLEIRKTRDAASLPIIMLTAKTQVSDLVNGLVSGANDYLIKPFIREELLARVRTHLDLKISHDQLAEYNHTLEEKVVKRTEQLHQQNLELQGALRTVSTAQEQLVEQRKMSALGGLVAGVAHEINTPVGLGITLASYLEKEISKFGDLMKQGIFKKSDLKRFVNTISDGSNHLLTNLNQASKLIQNFKQVAVDQSSEEKRKFFVKPYFEQVLSNLEGELKKKDLKIHLNCDSELQLFNYPGVFSQLLTNFVMNSLKHAYDEQNKGEISISIYIQKEDLIWIYKDDGQGIKKENVDKVFDPFFTTKRTGEGGTGLGLHIVYNLVHRKLHGKIHCESTFGEGTKFTIMAPVDS
jgi:PAS domain S-box-containing protein